MDSLALRRTAGLAIFALVGVLVAVAAIPAAANHVDTWPATAAANSASYWEDTFGPTHEAENDWSCTKDDTSGDQAYVLGSPPSGQTWRLLVVKAGNDHNDLYWNPTPGSGYAATGQGAGGWSHVILCSHPSSSSTTSSSTTSSSTTSSSTSTTSSSTTSSSTSSTTSTSSTSSTSSTTTTEATTPTTATTSTTISSTSTVPEEEEEDTEEPQTTTTVAPTVQGESTTTTVAAETETEDTLPFTGVDSDHLALVAFLALAAGAGLVLMTRQSSEAKAGRHLS